ncbi:MAG: S-methyl-5-thioribose-1-phosphate isomerase [Deltaproteobacteria bacterium]|nr:S-methyl-5-thioribose-1-phosphate isomerase [Deltaproteobacteria bacterium]
MILDQRRLPWAETYLTCRRLDQVGRAICTLAVRGAPAIGIAAAMGLVLGARTIRVKHAGLFRERLAAKAEILRAARPTAVNLSWALDRLLALAAAGPDHVDTLLAMLRRESEIMLAEDVAVNRALGRHGAVLVPDGARVITHCHTGAIATGGHGTALGILHSAREAGKEVSVIADETRPLLQGARLTAWECVAAGIPVQVCPDGASGVILSRGLADLAIVGADRIAMNGDTANKVGTYNLAVMCARHGVPFYVAAPLSTVDQAAASGEDIPLEQRDPEEVTHLAGRRIVAPGAGAINYAFDITTHDLITAIITEAGVLSPPYGESLARAKLAGPTLGD